MAESLERIKKIVGENKIVLEKKYSVKSIGVFGSYSRSEERRESDIDLLVDFHSSPDLFEFIRLEEFLSVLLGKRIDLVTKNALKPLIKEDILRETVYL